MIFIKKGDYISIVAFGILNLCCSIIVIMTTSFFMRTYVLGNFVSEHERLYLSRKKEMKFALFVSGVNPFFHIAIGNRS